MSRKRSRKRQKRGGTWLILAWWPHGSWGPEWPIVVETCVPGQFSQLCDVEAPWETEFWRLWFVSRTKNMWSGLWLYCTCRPNCRSQIPGPNNTIKEMETYFISANTVHSAFMLEKTGSIEAHPHWGYSLIWGFPIFCVSVFIYLIEIYIYIYILYISPVGTNCRCSYFGSVPDTSSCW